MFNTSQSTMASEEIDCSPLSQACIKALTDKTADKRKFAASEIAKMTVEFSISNNLTMINRLIIVLGRKFCLASNANTRKGGLLGLAAVMIGIKNGSVLDPPADVIEEVVRYILPCLIDSDSQVRYYACESLFNITKVARAFIISQFDSIFDSLARIVADKDVGVRAQAEELDRLLKDIVVEQDDLDMNKFVPRLEEYIYTKNPFTRMFIISWIRLLDTKIDIIQNHLPLLLDGIFTCLYDSAEEIRASTLNLLSEFLNKIVLCPTDKVNITGLMGTVLKHARNEDEDIVQYTAIAWLRQLIGLLDNQELIEFTPEMLEAIIPCLAFQFSPEGSVISHVRDRQSTNTQKFSIQSPSRGNICEISSLANSLLLDQVSTILKEQRNALSESIERELERIMNVLVNGLQRYEHPVIKMAILDWLKKLKQSDPSLSLLATSVQPKVFQILLETLSARSDAVVRSALRVLVDVFCCESNLDEPRVASPDIVEESDQPSTKEDEVLEPDKRKPVTSRMSLTSTSQRTRPGLSKKVAILGGATESASESHKSPNVTKFTQALCKMFADNELVFEERGNFIIMNLCNMVKPDIIYRSFAEILKDDKVEPRFAHKLVSKLNQILMTTKPFFGLRTRLSGASGTIDDEHPDVSTLFYSLYLAWCHSPVAALTLCLLTSNYRLASEIVTAISRTDITLEMLTQIDWVVQLIESPVFAVLRRRMLDSSSQNSYLMLSLYGLLMILPQSEAYKRLSHRLDQAYKYVNLHSQNTTTAATGTKEAATTKRANLTSSSVTSVESLIRHYHNIQNMRSKLNTLKTDTEFDY